MNPWIMGRMPDFFMSLKEVFNPIAASAHTIKNLLTDLEVETTAVGMGKILAMMDIAKNPKINQGKIFAILKLAVMSFSHWPFFMASFLCRCI